MPENENRDYSTKEAQVDESRKGYPGPQTSPERMPRLPDGPGPGSEPVISTGSEEGSSSQAKE